MPDPWVHLYPTISVAVLGYRYLVSICQFSSCTTFMFHAPCRTIFRYRQINSNLLRFDFFWRFLKNLNDITFKRKTLFLKRKIFLASCCFTDFGVYRKMPFYIKSLEKRWLYLPPFWGGFLSNFWTCNRYFLLCLHLDTISLRLLSVLVGSARQMASFSWRHKSQRLAPGL